MLCVLIVEGMFVVVNVMLYLMSVMSLPPALCNLSVHMVVKLCTLGVFALGVSFVSGYVALKYNKISLTCTAGSVWFVYSCGRPWSVCEVVSVPYVGALTLMRVLFVLHVSIGREYEDARVSAGH